MIDPVYYTVIAAAMFLIPLAIIVWGVQSRLRAFWTITGYVCIIGVMANSVIGYRGAEAIAERAETLEEVVHAAAIVSEAPDVMESMQKEQQDALKTITLTDGNTVILTASVVEAAQKRLMNIEPQHKLGE